MNDPVATKDLDFKIETTWLEGDAYERGFPRVVVVEYFNWNIPAMYGSTALSPVMSSALAARIIEKIKEELGLRHKIDYTFGTNANGTFRIVFRIKEEEHYAMFKLHYHG